MSLKEEIQEFKLDTQYIKYTHTRVSLGLFILTYDSKSNISYKRDFYSRFNTCSYSELTSCIRARVRWIREYVELLSVEEFKCKYPQTSEKIKESIETQKDEIRKLRVMRHILKRSGRRNWDAETLK